MVKVFVYGTLKRGYGNNRLLSSSKFISEAVTKDNYVLRNCGFPYLILDKGEEARPVLGEIYEVDKETLQSLDWLEGVPNHYQRINIQVEGDKTYNVFAYAVERNESRLPLCPAKKYNGREVYEWSR